MKLLLTSQGLPPELKDDFLSLLTKKPKDIKISYVTTAAYGEGGPRPEWLDYYKKQLNDCGITQIEELDIRDKTYHELATIISDKDIILVNGGNTFFLLYWVKKTGFDKIIMDHVNKNKLYIGISAGSSITCPTIEQSSWKHADRNIVGLKDLTALNLVPFLVSVHFDEKYRQAIVQGAGTTKYPVVAINDTQAVLVINNKWKVVGKGKNEFFNGFQENLY